MKISALPRRYAIVEGGERLYSAVSVAFRHWRLARSGVARGVRLQDGTEIAAKTVLKFRIAKAIKDEALPKR